MIPGIITKLIISSEFMWEESTVMYEDSQCAVGMNEGLRAASKLS